MSGDSSIQLQARVVEHTLAIGECIGAHVKPGTLIALSGPLGAGKTWLTKGIARGLGVPQWREVRSPTFTLLQTYPGGRLPLHHVDLYRLSDGTVVPREVADAMEAQGAICACEWAELFEELWPQSVIRVTLEQTGEETRSIAVSGADAGMTTALAELKHAA